MQLNVGNDMIILFSTICVAATNAYAQIDSSECAYRVFANDPSAQIFVDNNKIGSPPQIIDCSDQDKTIVVRSSDGQVFTRLLTARSSFNLVNSTLNVVFQKRMNDFVFQTGTTSYLKELKTSPDAENRMTAQAVPVDSPTRDLASAPILNPEEQHLKSLRGRYLQLFALKNLDITKIEQDIKDHYRGKVLQDEVILCPRKSTNRMQTLSLVLIGPFRNKSEALAAKNAIGGESFLVENPVCNGIITKVNL